MKKLMTPEEFAAWQQRSEEKIRKIREETEAIRRETAEFRRLADKEMKEFRRRVAKEAAEERQRARKEMAEWRAERKEAERAADARLEKMDKRFGGFIDNESVRLEDEFHDALVEAGEIDGHKLEEVHVRLEAKRDGRRVAESDLTALNGGAVFVGEIKRNLTAKKVRDFYAEALPKFAKHFPVLARGKKIIGMVGGAVVKEDAIAEAAKRGMLVLRLKNRKLLVDNADKARPVN